MTSDRLRAQPQTLGMGNVHPSHDAAGRRTRPLLPVRQDRSRVFAYGRGDRLRIFHRGTISRSPSAFPIVDHVAPAFSPAAPVALRATSYTWRTWNLPPSGILRPLPPLPSPRDDAMNLLNFETLLLGINNLRLHKLRSLLTALGIIFGVAAVICMLSVSEGVTADELRMIQLLGTRNIIVSSVKPPATTQVAESNTSLLEYGLTYNDMKLIQKTIPHVARVVPLKTVAERVNRQARQMNAQVVGTTPEFFECVNVTAARGRLLSWSDEHDVKNVCVIGKTVQERLFAYEDPLDQSIFVERYEGLVPYKVIGVLSQVDTAGAPQRGVAERNLNEEVFIPYSTATRRYGEVERKMGSGSRELVRIELSGLYVSVDELENVLPVSTMVARCLDHGHEKLDYDMRVPLQSLRLAERKKRNSQYLLGFIAGISLLVGGIGIMNIMLATVTERTREIGIRRALGARRLHITVQFLIETVLLSTAGGLLGVLLGYGGAKIISHFADWGDAIVRPWAVLISFCLSVMVGIFFGMWPAMKAARLDPIEALRYE